MTRFHVKRRISRRIGRIRWKIRRAIKAVYTGFGRLLRALVPLGGMALICYAAFLTNLALGFLVSGVVLLVIDWWVENQ